MDEFWIYDIICPGADLYDIDSINAILRRMVELYCYCDKDEYNELDAFISFYEWNVDHDSVPKDTFEGFDNEEDDILCDWECDAMRVEEELIRHVHFPRGPYRKKRG